MRLKQDTSSQHVQFKNHVVFVSDTNTPRTLAASFGHTICHIEQYLLIKSCRHFMNTSRENQHSENMSGPTQVSLLSLQLLLSLFRNVMKEHKFFYYLIVLHSVFLFLNIILLIWVKLFSGLLILANSHLVKSVIYSEIAMKQIAKYAFQPYKINLDKLLKILNFYISKDIL